MSLAHARALLPRASTLVEAADTAQETAALSRLAAWALRFSPTVAPDPPDGLLIDTTGCAHLSGGEGAMLSRIRRALNRLGFAARLAVAPTFACAWALARFAKGNELSVAPGGCAAAAGHLPVAALRISPQTTAGLAELGVERIEEARRLPRSQVPSRFSAELLTRLDLVTGDAPMTEHIVPVAPPQPPTVGMDFDGPTVHMSSIEAALRRAIDQLCTSLASKRRGSRSLAVTITRSNLPPIIFDIVTTLPTDDPRHLWTLMRPRVERLQTGWGVDGLVLVARHTGRIRDTQINIDSVKQALAPQPSDSPHQLSGEGRRELAGLADLYLNRFERTRLLVPRPGASYIPERGAALAPFVGAGPLPEHTPAQEPQPPRPSLLLMPPEPARVIALPADGPPARVQWRSRDLRITRAVGPERISPEWWTTPTTGARDWYRVQEEHGLWLWVLRDCAAGTWAVHGLWV
jgi:protein ImuB